MSYKCEYCDNSYINKCHLTRHQKTESCIKIQNIIFKKDEIYKNKSNELNNTIVELKNDNLNLNKKILTLEIKLKEVSDKSDEYRKIVEKSATKSTNTVKNYTHNNYLNYISTEPIKFKDLKSQVRQIVNCETIMYNDDDFHDHIVDNILRDKSGKDKVLCTDINRKNFTYKDEKSGELISDPELERLREQLKKGTDIRKIRDLLEKLVNEYEENGCIGMDPYKQFSDIIQKLNFGSPFVDHIAKKTYIKTKNTVIQKNNNESRNEESFDEGHSSRILDELEYNEEEYQKLLEEFGEEDI
jgi:hypothetical protein